MQLEASLRLLVERSKALKTQEIRLATTEAENSSLKMTVDVKNTLDAKSDLNIS